MEYGEIGPCGWDGVIIFCSPNPKPSITARNTPPTIADLAIEDNPARHANAAPVDAPAAIAFNGSSFRRKCRYMQSNDEKHNPQTAKFPPSTGALAAIAFVDPVSLALKPGGELRYPLTQCQTAPPIDPMQNA